MGGPRTRRRGEALRLDPDAAEVRLRLAMIYEGRGKQHQALEETRRALVLRPDWDDGLRWLAYIFLDLGQNDAALDAARRAVAQRSRAAENHDAVGWVLFSSGRFGEAAAAYQRATELQPDNARAFQMLGTSVLQAGDFERAVDAFTESIRLAPDARAWANLGYVHYARGRLKDAVRAYEEAVRLEPSSGTIRRSLGDARAKAGDAGGARVDWKAATDLSRVALRVNPRNTRQLKNVAICLAKLGERNEARLAADQALEAGAKDADTRYGVAVVHALVGDSTMALTLLAQAFELGASPTQAEQDDDLAAVRMLPAFRSLIDKAKAALTKGANAG